MDYSHRHSHSNSTVVSGVSLSRILANIPVVLYVFLNAFLKKALVSDIPLTCTAYF